MEIQRPLEPYIENQRPLESCMKISQSLKLLEIEEEEEEERKKEEKTWW